MSLREQFLAFDDELHARGVPRCSDWWRARIGEWLDAYEARHVLELWACVGRGAAKSTALYKLALFFTLFVAFDIPPGERHYAVILSRQKDEAAKGLAIIGAWLSLLDVPRTPSGDELLLDEDPSRGILVVSASVAATSGWRAFFVGKDERSKWPGSAGDEKDADEIDTSATAMTATHPRAPSIAFGSAWGAFGTFFDAITSGSDDAKIVAGPVSTWVAAPHIRAEDLRRKERDPVKFAREYESKFQAARSSAFDPAAVERAFAHARPAGVRQQPHFIIDASSLRNDRFTGAIVRWIRPRVGDWKPYLLFERVFTLGEGGFWRQKPASEIADHIKALAREWKFADVHGDQRDEYTWRSLLEDRGFTFHVHAYSGPSKPLAVERARRHLADQTIALGASADDVERDPDFALMRNELFGFEEQLTSGGTVTFGARGSQHDDFVALVLTACLAELRGPLDPSRETDTYESTIVLSRDAMPGPYPDPRR